MIPETPDTAAWGALRDHFRQVRGLHMRDLFAADPERFPRFTLAAAGLLLDYSKNRITGDTLKLLFALARERDVEGAIGRMFAAERINTTEHRAALHTALRNRSERPMMFEGEDVMPGVRAVLEQMRRFVESVHSGAWRGFSGRPITDVVNIGIGGSHLGPMLAVRALAPYAHGEVRVHFVANVDASEIAPILQGLDPQTTLFVVASKSFTTLETMLNARTAREWLLRHARGPEAVARHFVAVSTNLEGTEAFGIAPESVFAFWDWVGGRYSLWSAIGLPVALYLGMDHFEELLGGGFAMDEHFRGTDLQRNLPVLMALLGVWYNNFFGTQSRAVVPYDEYLCHLPAYLQQLEMESNGKRTQRDGADAPWPTAPVVWGATGTNGQHAFFQLLHQGNRLVPVDFLAPLEPQHPIGKHHAWLLANCLAQSEALMRGRTAEETRSELAGKEDPQSVAALVPHKVFPGNRPSNTLLYQRLTPATLGTLIALYEHKVYVEGVLWNINSFDQWGVELGKQLAGKIRAELAEGVASADHDASTRGLIGYYLKHT